MTRNTGIKGTTFAMAAALAVAGTLSLAACGKSSNATNENGGTKTVAADHDNWTTVSDPSGRVWCTVVKISPSVGSDLDEGKLVSDLAKAKTFDWTRVICSDNRSTNEKEVAYLILASSSDYRQISNAKSEMEEKGWKCTMLDATTYDSYVQQTKDGSYPFAETTYVK